MKGSNGQDDGTMEKQTEAAEAVGAAAEGMGVAMESVGAEKGVSEVDGSGGKETEVIEIGARYPSRDRKTAGKFWVSETGWVTPKAKKRVGKSG